MIMIYNIFLHTPVKEKMIFTATLLFFNIIFVVTAAYSNEIALSQEECPLWYSPGKDGNCTCGDSLDNIVDCPQTKEHTLYLKDCFCMTLDPSQQEPVVGSCIYTCYHCVVLYYILKKLYSTTLQWSIY